MAVYQILEGGIILRLADLASIPPLLGNTDYRKYLADVAAGAIVTPYTPPPADTAAPRLVEVNDVRTTNATITTLVAWSLALQTLYAARFTVTAIDVGNADCRAWTAKVTAKRVNGGALLIGTPTLETSHADAGAASWALAADVTGNDFRVRITGAAGRTISWSLLGEIVRARPDGLVD